MATRREIKPATVDLENLILQYAGFKEQESTAKKAAEKLNKSIKNEFSTRKIDEFVVGTIKATVTVQPNEDFNESQAIEILRKELSPEDFEHCVKTKEYLDDDCFEDLVYSNKVDAGILMPCRSPKPPTITLRIGKVK